MKCFALWINEDGSAQVAELAPEQGEALVAEVEAQPAESAEAAIQMLTEMSTSQGEGNPEEEVMRGYSSGAKSMYGQTGKMSPAKVFGDEQ